MTRGQVTYKAGRVRGWALGPDNGTVEIAAVDMKSGDRLWAGSADKLRPHVKWDKKNCGFDFFVGGSTVTPDNGIRFVDTATGQDLPFSPLKFKLDDEQHVERLNKLSNWPLIHFQGTNVQGDKTLARIVAVGAEGLNDASFFVENAAGKTKVEDRDVRVAPNNDGQHFWYAYVWPKTSFTINLTKAFEQPLKDESGVPYVRLSLQSAPGQTEIGAVRDVGLVPPEAIVIPPESNVRRVQAKGGINQKFLASAFSQYRTYRQVFEKYSGRNWASIEHVFDWGCGCGRVTQHLMRNLGPEKVFGADIDGANIEWCVSNLKSQNFKQCDLMPPLPFEDNFFDFIIATSVLTHIQETMVGAWLSDINRILKKGGIAALTVGGETRMAFGSYDLERLDAVEAKGIEDGIANRQLDSVIDDKDYYRNVRMTKDYIRKTWSPVFEVLEVIDHGIGVQDIVVCRKRG